jgi:hypothetical protein
VNESVEIRVRLFYTSDESEASITPAATFRTNSEATADLVGGQVSGIVAGLKRQLDELMAGPIPDLRAMTAAEIEEFRREEREEEDA